MSFSSGFRGTKNGSVQANYTDQPGVGVPGMLMFASDINLCDAMFIGETGGIAAGRGVHATINTNSPNNLQRPDRSMYLPTSADTTEATLYGVLVFGEDMQSDENGVPGWAVERVGKVLRYGARVGGRIYVKAIDAWDPATSTVNWVTVGGTDLKYKAGQFSPAALAGSAGAGYSVALTLAKVVTVAAAGDIVGIEFI
jgi:hypothetical protein